MTSVLMVLSAARQWTLTDGTEHPTGVWAEEFLVPYQLFTDAGFDVTIATPEGKKPVFDEVSLSEAGGVSDPDKLKAELDKLQPELDAPAALADVADKDFDLVFYPGGHGPMEDLAEDQTSGALLTKRMNAGQRVALLCHAPAASLAAKNEDGSWPFKGYKMTGFSNPEEKVNDFAEKAKWLLEDRLTEGGAEYSKGEPFTQHVVVDRHLYTGQNPQSSEELARRIIEDLKG